MRIRSKVLALFNHRGLNLKGICPKFVGMVKEREMGLWSEVAEEIMREVGRKSFCRKEVLTRKWSSLAAMCPGPVILLLQVNLPFLGMGSSISRSAIKSSSFSPKESLIFKPPLFSELDFVVLKSPTMIKSFPYRSTFMDSKESKKSIFSL